MSPKAGEKPWRARVNDMPFSQFKHRSSRQVINNIKVLWPRAAAPPRRASKFKFIIQHVFLSRFDILMNPIMALQLGLHC